MRAILTPPIYLKLVKYLEEKESLQTHIVLPLSWHRWAKSDTSEMWYNRTTNSYFFHWLVEHWQKYSVLQMKFKAKSRWKALPLSHTFYSAGGMDQVRPESMDQYGNYWLGEVIKGEFAKISAERMVSTFDFHPALCASGCLWRYRGADRLHTPFKGKQARQSETKDTFCSSF